MPVHTMEVLRKLNARDARAFTASQRWFSHQQVQDLLYNGRSRITSRIYPHTGVREANLHRSSVSSKYFFLSLVINPASLSRGVMTLGLYHCPIIGVALNTQFQNALAAMTPGMHHPNLRDWSVQEIHYALDVRTPHVSRYIELFNRARLPASFNAPRGQTGSFYVESTTRDVTINFYDKANQFARRWNRAGSAQLAQQAQDILRLEVQCRGDKLQHIRRKYAQYDFGLSPATYLTEDIANRVLQEYYRSSVGYSDFHSLAGANNLVDAGPGRIDRKRKLKHFLTLLDQSATVNVAVQSYLTGVTLSSGVSVQGGQRTLENYLNRYLPELSINPVLIPAAMNLATLTNPMPPDCRIL